MKLLQTYGFLSILCLLCAVASVSTPIGNYSHLEQFTSTEYRDAVQTTALWDTAAGELRLPPFPYELVKNDPGFWGYGHHVEVSGNYAYMTCQGYMMAVIDITDPADFSNAGGYNETDVGALGIDVEGDYAFLACMEKGLYIIDISNPLGAIRTGYCRTAYNARNVRVAGDYAYVADADSGLTVVDVSDPANPVIAGRYTTPNWADDIALYGDYAFVPAYTSGLMTFDISDPKNPTFAGQFGIAGRAYAVALWGNRLFLMTSDTMFNSILMILDITDPTDPISIHDYDPPGTPSRMIADGNYLYIADSGSNTFEIMDISDPASPVPLGSAPAMYSAIDLEIAGGYAFVPVSAAGFSVIRVREVKTPILAGTYDTPGSALKVAVSGQYAFVADAEGGLRSVDISDPWNIAPAGHYDSPGSSGHVVVSGNLAFLADGADLRIFDISDPASPTLLGIEYTPCNCIAVSGNYAFITDPDAGALHTIDISDPVHPTNAGSYTALSRPYAVAVSGDHAFVIDPYGTDLNVLDITDPTSPSLAGTYNSVSFSRNIAIDGDYAFIAFDTGGMKIIDIKNPAAPSYIASLPASKVQYVAVTGDYAFVANSDLGVLVADISDPGSPVLLHAFDTPGAAHGLCLAGDYCFVADGEAGLHALQVLNGRFETGKDKGQSLVVDVAEGTIDHVMLTSTQSDSIRWDVSADSGAHWQEIPLGTAGGWQPLTYPGSGLMWRANLVYTGGATGPACSELTLYYKDDTATLLQSCSAAYHESEERIEIEWILSELDEGVVFHVLRFEEPSDEFTLLPAGRLTRNGLAFTYIDADLEPGVTYRYRVEFTGETGRHLLFESDPVTTPPLPLTLFQNFPNPFNPQTTIKFYLPEGKSVRLDIYDVCGRRIAALAARDFPKGLTVLTWDGTNASGGAVASGIYYYRLRAGKETISKKMILLR